MSSLFFRCSLDMDGEGHMKWGLPDHARTSHIQTSYLGKNLFFLTTPFCINQNSAENVTIVNERYVSNAIKPSPCYQLTLKNELDTF